MPVRVLTVCTGNVCRSAMAQVILERALTEAGVPAIVDSAGISDEEHGNPMDPRAQKVLSEHGYQLPEHSARRVEPSDLETSDLVLAMTRVHYRSLLQLATTSGIDDTSNICLYRSFEFGLTPDSGQELELDGSVELDIADPWYGDLADFEETYHLLTAGAPHIVDYLSTIQDKAQGEIR